VPTHEESPEFWRLWAQLSDAQKQAFRKAVAHFIADLESGGPFRKGLRVKGIRGWRGMFEMTWADDGRAVFSYGDSIVPGEPHVIWHAIGDHGILP
jgi:hypothetical protein